MEINIFVPGKQFRWMRMNISGMCAVCAMPSIGYFDVMNLIGKVGGSELNGFYVLVSNFQKVSHLFAKTGHARKRQKNCAEIVFFFIILRVSS